VPASLLPAAISLGLSSLLLTALSGCSGVPEKSYLRKLEAVVRARLADLRRLTELLNFSDIEAADRLWRALDDMVRRRGYVATALAIQRYLAAVANVSAALPMAWPDSPLREVYRDFRSGFGALESRHGRRHVCIYLDQVAAILRDHGQKLGQLEAAQGRVGFTLRLLRAVSPPIVTRS